GRNRQEQAHRQRSQREDRLIALRSPVLPGAVSFFSSTDPPCLLLILCHTDCPCRRTILKAPRLWCSTLHTAARPTLPISPPRCRLARCVQQKTPGSMTCGATPSIWACHWWPLPFRALISTQTARSKKSIRCSWINPGPSRCLNPPRSSSARV